jgi:hypothetical protein
MADDETAIRTDFPVQPSGWGAFQQVPTAPAPPRGVWGWVGDQLVDVGKAALDIPASFAGAATRLPGTPEEQASRLETQDFFIDLMRRMDQSKSKYAQQQAAQGGPKFGENTVDAITGAVMGLVGSAPALLAGPLAPGVFGTQAFGSLQNQLREAYRDATPEELNTVPAYREARGRGLSHEQARDEAYAQSNDLVSNLIAGGTGALGGGLLQKMGGRATNRLITDALTDRIVQRSGEGLRRRLAVGGVEGFGAGAVMGAGGEGARQRAMGEAGLGPAETDWGRVFEAGKESGLGLGVVGGAMRGVMGRRPGERLYTGRAGEQWMLNGRPATEAEVRAAHPEIWANARQAPEIGTEQGMTASGQVNEGERPPAYMPQPEQPALPGYREYEEQQQPQRPPPGRPVDPNAPPPYMPTPEGPARPAYLPPGAEPIAERGMTMADIGRDLPAMGPPRPPVGETRPGPRGMVPEDVGMPAEPPSGPPGLQVPEMTRADLMGRAPPAVFPQRRRAMVPGDIMAGDQRALAELEQLKAQRENIRRQAADLQEKLNAEAQSREPGQSVEETVAEHPDLQRAQRQVEGLWRQHDNLDQKIRQARSEIIRQRRARQVPAAPEEYEERQRPQVEPPGRPREEGRHLPVAEAEELPGYREYAERQAAEERPKPAGGYAPEEYEAYQRPQREPPARPKRERAHLPEEAREEPPGYREYVERQGPPEEVPPEPPKPPPTGPGKGGLAEGVPALTKVGMKGREVLKRLGIRPEKVTAEGKGGLALEPPEPAAEQDVRLTLKGKVFPGRKAPEVRQGISGKPVLVEKRRLARGTAIEREKRAGRGEKLPIRGAVPAEHDELAKVVAKWAGKPGGAEQIRMARERIEERRRQKAGKMESEAERREREANRLDAAIDALERAHKIQQDEKTRLRRWAGQVASLVLRTQDWVRAKREAMAPGPPRAELEPGEPYPLPGYEEMPRARQGRVEGELTRHPVITMEELSARIEEELAKVPKNERARLRKQKIAQWQYNERERIARHVAEDGPDVIGVGQLAKLITEGFTRKFAEGDWGKWQPRGKRGEAFLAQESELGQQYEGRVDHLPLRQQIRLFHTATDQLDPASLVRLANQLRENVLARRLAYRKGLEALAQNWKEEGYLKVIRLTLGDRTGVGEYHNRIAHDYKAFADAIAEALGGEVIRGRHRAVQVGKLRDLISEYFNDELAVQHGGIGELELWRREQLRSAQDNFRRRLAGLSEKPNDPEVALLRQQVEDIDAALRDAYEDDDLSHLRPNDEKVEPADLVADERPSFMTEEEYRAIRAQQGLTTSFWADRIPGIDRRVDRPKVAETLKQAIDFMARLMPTEIPGGRQLSAEQRYAAAWDLLDRVKREAMERWMQRRFETDNIDEAREALRAGYKRTAKEREDEAVKDNRADWYRENYKRFGPEWAKLDEAHRQLSVLHGVLVTPRDTITADGRTGRSISQMTAKEVADRAKMPEMAWGDLNLPFSEQLALVERVLRGEGSDLDNQAYTRSLLARMSRLRDAVDSLNPTAFRDPETAWRSDAGLRRLHDEMRRRAGEPADRDPRPDTVLDDLRRWEAEAKDIEGQLRQIAELTDPDVALAEYGIGNLLSADADLRAPGALPKGSSVTTLAQHLSPDAFYGTGHVSRIRRHFLDMATKLVGHLDLVHVTDEHMKQLAANRGLKEVPPAFYDPVTDRLFITHDAMKGANRTRILLHEVAHPIMESAAQKFPVIRQRLDEQRQALKDIYNDLRNPAGDIVRRLLDGNDHGLDNVHEFFSELWSNDNFAQALHEVQTTPAQRARWQTGARATVLDGVIRQIRRGLSGMFFSVSKNRLLNDATVAGLDVLRRLEERGRTRPYVTEETAARPITAGGKGRRVRESAMSDEAIEQRRVLDEENLSNLIKQIEDTRQHLGYRMTSDRRFPMPAEQRTAVQGVLDAINAPFDDIGWPAYRDNLQKAIHKLIAEHDEPYQPNDERLLAKLAMIDSARDIQKAMFKYEMGGIDPNRVGLGPIINEMIRLDQGLPAEQRRVVQHRPLHELVQIAADFMQRNQLEGWQSAVKAGRLFTSPAMHDAEATIFSHLGWEELRHRRGGRSAGGLFTGDLNRVLMPDYARPEVAIHESGHAATYYAIEKYPALQATLQKIMDHVQGTEEYRTYLDSDPERIGIDTPADYAMTDPHEFAAEFYGRPRFREFLRTLRTPPELMAEVQGAKNLFDATVRLVVKYIKKFMGNVDAPTLDEFTAKVMEDVIRANERLQLDLGLDMPPAERVIRESRPLQDTSVTRRAGEWSTEKLHSLGETVGNLSRHGFFRNLGEFARRIDPALGELTDRIVDTLGRIQTRQEKIAREIDAPVIRNLIEAMGRGDPKLKNEALLAYADMENYAKVFGSSELFTDENAFLQRDNPSHQQAILNYPKVRAAFLRLSPEDQQTVRMLRKALMDRHEGVLDAVLQALAGQSKWLVDGTPGAISAVKKLIRGEALFSSEQRALDDDFAGATQSKADFDKQVEAWRRIPAFRKIEGPFYPMMRHGDFMVHGHYDLQGIVEEHNRRNPGDQINMTVASDRPTGLQRIEFSNDADRDRFVRFISLHPDYDFNITSVGKDHLYLNHEHFSGHESSRAAERELAELQTDPHFVPANVSIRRDVYTDQDTPIHALSAIDRVIEGMRQSSFYRDQPGGLQKQLENNLRELGYRYLLSSAARSKYMTRKYTRGADENLVKNVVKYLHNTSYTMAEQQLRPALHRNVQAFDKYIGDRKWRKDPATGQPTPENAQYSLNRSRLQAEVHKRLAMRPEEHNSTWVDRRVNSLIRLAQLAKLGSPSYHIMNGFEPGAMATPIVGGDYGMVAALREAGRAYALFGSEALRLMKNDIAKVWRAGIGGDPELTNMVKSISQRILDSGTADGKDLVRMIDFLHDTGYLHRDAGMDIARHYDPTSGLAGRLFDYLDSYQRAIGAAVEAQNRAVSAIMAYRVARAEGGMGHDEAARYAQRVLEKSAGNYAWYNKPGIMNSKSAVWRMATQFKNYALRATQDYMLMTLGAYHHLKGDSANPAEAQRNRLLARQLARQVAVQGLVSGMFGQFFWTPVTAATNALSLITGYNADDLEHDIRAGMTDIIGRDLTEFITRGGIRMLGSSFGGGIGERMSHSNLWTYGTLGEKRDNWYEALGHLAGGAAAGTLFDIGAGVGDVWKGVGHYADGRVSQGTEQVLRGLKLASPVKVVGDGLGVVANSIYGEHAPGGAVKAEPDAGTMVSNLLGARTGQQLERQEATATFLRADKQAKDARTELNRAYAMADTAEEKRTILNENRRRYNAGVPKEQRITVEEMMKYARTYYKKREAGPHDLGVTVSKRMRPAFEDLSSVYSYQ